MKNISRNMIVGIGLLLPLTALASEGWDWTAEPTPGAENTIVGETGETPENYENGDLSDDIVLSELMPNPEGTDNDFEWIEIYNTGSTNVDLGNWSLDDEEGGSSPYVFPAGTLIEAQDFLVVYRSESGLSLNNDTDEVRLFDFENTLKDSVVYDGSPEGQSYARISLENGESLFSWFIPTAHASEGGTDWSDVPWQWTAEITQGFTNPVYYLIQGEILERIPFTDSVTLDWNGSPIEVSLTTLDINEELKNSMFQVGNVISGYAVRVDETLYELRTFESLIGGNNGVEPQGNTVQKVFLFLAMAACAAGLILYRRKMAIAPR